MTANRPTFLLVDPAVSSLQERAKSYARLPRAWDPRRIPAAKPLVLGALSVTEETTRQALPTATGFAARQALAFLRNRNVALTPLLRRASLSERDFDNSSRISAVAQCKLLEYAAEAVDDSAFGLHLAERVNPRAAGLLFYVASAAINLARRWRSMNATSG